MSRLLFVLLLCTRPAFGQDAASVAEQICLAGPQLVGLGESEHNDDQQHLFKLALLQELHSRCTVGALYFESPFTDAVLALIEQKPYSYFVYPFWKTKAVYPGLSGFIEKNKVTVAGLDPQENCSFLYLNRYLLEQGYISGAMRATAQRSDALLALAIAQYPGAKTRALSATEAALVIAAQDTLINELKRTDKQPAYTALLVRCLENRKVLARLLAYTRSQDKIRLREEMMAANIDFLEHHFSTGRQGITVIWAANRHIALRNAFGREGRKDKPAGMMERYAAGSKQRLFSTGIFADGASTGDLGFDLAAFAGARIRVTAEEFNHYDCRR